jgi:hypothetical protein
MWWESPAAETSGTIGWRATLDIEQHDTATTRTEPMGVQFLVTPGQLGEMASTLMGLKDEFDGIDDRVDGYERATGPDVADALGSFAGNWSDKRKEIAGYIETTAGAAQTAADAYQDAESAIAQSSTDAQEQMRDG